MIQLDWMLFCAEQLENALESINTTCTYQPSIYYYILQTIFEKLQSFSHLRGTETTKYYVKLVLVIVKYFSGSIRGLPK